MQPSETANQRMFHGDEKDAVDEDIALTDPRLLSDAIQSEFLDYEERAQYKLTDFIFYDEVTVHSLHNEFNSRGLHVGRTHLAI